MPGVESFLQEATGDDGDGYFSPGLTVLEGVSVDESLQMIQEACGPRDPGVLRFSLKPDANDADVCFEDPEEVASTLERVRRPIVHGRWRPHGRMIDALPVFAGELHEYCEEGDLAISSLFMRFASIKDMRVARLGEGILAADIMWHTDLRYYPESPGEEPRTILPEREGDQKITASLTILPGDGSLCENGTQYIRGVVDTDGARVVRTVEELDAHEKAHPDKVAIDVRGRPTYVPDEMIAQGLVRSAPEGRVIRIPQSAVHRSNPEMYADGGVQGRVLLTAFLRSRNTLMHGGARS